MFQSECRCSDLSLQVHDFMLAGQGLGEQISYASWLSLMVWDDTRLQLCSRHSSFSLALLAWKSRVMRTPKLFGRAGPGPS